MRGIPLVLTAYKIVKINQCYSMCTLDMLQRKYPTWNGDIFYTVYGDFHLQGFKILANISGRTYMYKVSASGRSLTLMCGYT